MTKYIIRFQTNPLTRAYILESKKYTHESTSTIEIYIGNIWLHHSKIRRCLQISIQISISKTFFARTEEIFSYMKQT